MRLMIFSINQTFQRFLASIAQGGGGWSSTPPKFALDQKKKTLDLFNAHRWAVPTLLGTTGLDNGLTDDGKVVSPTHRLHFTLQKHYYFCVSGTHFC
jgi:hypothetical protein